MLQIGTALLLQIGAGVVTNRGSYYKLEQPLLKNRAAVTSWEKVYYKLGQLLQFWAQHHSTSAINITTMAISQKTQYWKIAQMSSKYWENVSVIYSSKIY